MAHRFRTLAVGTAALTGVLMLLGIYTAAAGAGLTCAQRWPLCDGFLGLFPANWPSFVEWFHRLVAMITGFVILGTTVQAWRTRRHRRVRYALAVALAILPAQIVLGGLTVTRYEWLVLLAHFATATAIFALLVLAAVWSFDDDDAVRAVARGRASALVAAGILPVAAALSPRLLIAFTAVVQVVYYAAALTAFAALVAATVWLRTDGTRAATGLAAALVGLLLVVGRQTYGEAGVYGTVGVLAVAFCCAAAAVQRSKADADLPTDRFTE